MLLKVLLSLPYFHILIGTTMTQNLVQNMLVNGSVGKVIGYSTAKRVLEERKLYGDHIYISIDHDLVHLRSPTTRTASSKDEAHWELSRWVNDTTEWPVVRFYRGRSRDVTVDILCVPRTFVTVVPNGNISAFREQVSAQLLCRGAYFTFVVD